MTRTQIEPEVIHNSWPSKLQIWDALRFPDFLQSHAQGIKVIYKRLFRIYAHVFHSHFKARLRRNLKHFPTHQTLSVLGLKAIDASRTVVLIQFCKSRKWWTVMQTLICAQLSRVCVCREAGPKQPNARRQAHTHTWIVHFMHLSASSWSHDSKFWVGNNSLTLKGETQVTKQTPSTKQKTTVQPTPRTYEANPINTTGINSSNKAGTFTRSEGGVFVGRRPPSLLPAPCSSSKTVEVLSLYRLATHTQMTHTHTLSLSHTHTCMQTQANTPACHAVEEKQKPHRDWTAQGTIPSSTSCTLWKSLTWLRSQSSVLRNGSVQPGPHCKLREGHALSMFWC